VRGPPFWLFPVADPVFRLAYPAARAPLVRCCANPAPSTDLPGMRRCGAHPDSRFVTAAARN